MLKQLRRYQRRLAGIALAGVLLFAMGPFALVPMTVWAGTPCHDEAPVAVAEACHDTTSDHHGDRDHANQGDCQGSKAPCAPGHCPASDMHCCGAPSCGLAAILPDFGLPFFSAGQCPLPACEQSAGSFIAISLPRPPAA